MVSRACLTLEDGIGKCPGRLVTNYRSTLHNVSEERKPAITKTSVCMTAVTLSRPTWCGDRRPDVPDRRPDVPDRRPDVPDRRPDVPDRRPDVPAVSGLAGTATVFCQYLCLILFPYSVLLYNHSSLII